MEFYKGMMVGLFIGVFAGAFLLGLMQMIKRKDDIYEKLILEQGRAKRKGKLCEPDNYFDYFNSHCDRRVLSDRRSKSGETGDSDNRILHHVNGHLGVPKSSGR